MHFTLMQAIAFHSWNLASNCGHFTTYATLIDWCSFICTLDNIADKSVRLKWTSTAFNILIYFQFSESVSIFLSIFESQHSVIPTNCIKIVCVILNFKIMMMTTRLIHYNIHGTRKLFIIKLAPSETYCFVQWAWKIIKMSICLIFIKWACSINWH